MITQLSQLDEHALHDLTELLDRCSQVDANTIPTYQHLLILNRPKPSIYLYYLNQQLVGFLSLYFFYENACEAALLVDPQHRGQGIATELLQTANPFIEAERIQNLIFSAIPANKPWLSQRELSYHQSEYQMLRTSKESEPQPKQSLTIREALQDDIQILRTIDKACFLDEERTSTHRFQTLLNDSQHTLYLAFLNKTPIGKAHIRWEDTNAHLSDIAVFPPYQKQGLGTEIIRHCVNLAINKGKTTQSLDVLTQNKHAIHLYTKLHFEIVNSCDYWLAGDEGGGCGKDVNTFKKLK